MLPPRVVIKEPVVLMEFVIVMQDLKELIVLRPWVNQFSTEIKTKKIKTLKNIEDIEQAFCPHFFFLRLHF